MGPLNLVLQLVVEFVKLGVILDHRESLPSGRYPRLKLAPNSLKTIIENKQSWRRRGIGQV